MAELDNVLPVGGAAGTLAGSTKQTIEKDIKAI
jgi:hypothetical protein